MWKRKLEEQIEATRKKMEDTAKVLGIGHPKVYQLSVELDQLHNEWLQLENKEPKYYSLNTQEPENDYFRTVV